MIDINIGIIAVQLISFSVAVFILWKIAWKPMIAFMESRKNKIEDDINKARESRENAIKLENSYKSEISEINVKAKEMINKAQAEGNIFRENIIKEAHEEAKKIIENAKKDINEEKEKTKKELQKEALDLSILISEKILKNKLDELLPELKNIAEIIYNDKKFFYFLNHLSVPFSEKNILINKITDNKKIIKLLVLLTKTKRFDDLNEVIRQLILFKDINDDHIDMILKTPLDISENTLKKLQAVIEKFINKKVNIKIENDAGLIGGIFIKIGDKIIDYSVKNQLNSLKESLLPK